MKIKLLTHDILDKKRVFKTFLKSFNFFLFLIFSLFTQQVIGQTLPNVQSLPISQNFGTTSFNAYPAGFQGWTGTNVSATVPATTITDATISAVTAVQSSNGIYGYAVSSNASIYLQTTGTGDQNLAKQLVLALKTTGHTSIKLSYTLKSTGSNTRPVGVLVQYKVGSAGVWTSVGSSNNPFTYATTSSTVSPTFTLPADVENKDAIYIRWAQLKPGTGSGSFIPVLIDDISVTGTVTATCAGPTLSATASASSITTAGANLTGSLTATGGANVTEEGFEYSTGNTLPFSGKVNTTALSVSTVPHTINKTVAGLQSNTLYYYRAYSTNGCTTPQTGFSHLSGFPTFTTVSLAPNSLGADNIFTDSFRAKWSEPASQGSASFTYHLQIDNDNDFSSPIYDNENETTFNHTQNSLIPNTTYYYRVAVKNEGGQSAWSSTQTVTTSASSKPVVTASVFTGVTVNSNFSRNITATNSPNSYAVVAGSNLPAGLTLNTTTGLISGVPINAGTFTTDVTATKGLETSDPATLTFVIGKGSQSISGLEATHANVYGDSSYELSAVSTSGLPVYYTSSNLSVATINGNFVNIIGAGVATITAKQDGNVNWNPATDATQTLTVVQKTLTIVGLSPQDKVYDQTSTLIINGTPQYSGLVNGENFDVNGTVAWSFPDKNVGNAKILVRNGDYLAPSENYTVNQPLLLSSVTKRNIAITSIVANNKDYDGTMIASFSNVDSSEVLVGDDVYFSASGNFENPNAENNKRVTVLTINLSGADGINYNIPNYPSGLTANISKANQTITVSNFPAVLNVGAFINLATYATSSSLLTLNYVSSTPVIASVSSGILTGNNAGITTITFSQAGDNNYNPAPSVQRNIEVVQIPVPLAQWDFYNVTSSATLVTMAATNVSSSLDSNSAILSRGPSASGSAGGNSFRTQGFLNDGISVSNNDYFQTSLTATNEIVSLTSIRAYVNGTSTFMATPGVDIQFAYSFNNIDYILINSPIKKIGAGQIDDINLAGVNALQNIAPNTTVYFRFYASGRTTTGGYGFASPEEGAYGLEFNGRLKPTKIIWDGFSWSNFNGPDGSQNALIDGAYNQTNQIGAFEVNNLEITTNGSLTIQPNQGITVNGDISAPDDAIVIESDGSLVQTKIENANGNGKIIAKRKVNMKTADYTYWSSPVAGQVLRNTVNGNTANSTGGFSPGTPNNLILQYNEVNDGFKVTTDATFVPAKGYAIRGKSTYGLDFTADELAFRGTLHNGDYNIPVQKSKNTLINGVSTEHGYNLIGNPYPSHIDFYKLYALSQGEGVRNSDIISATAWFWTNVPGAPTTQNGSSYNSNNYATLNLSGGAPATGSDDIESPEPNQFIKVGQGFIVQVATTPPTGTTPDVATLKFDNSIRTNDSSGFFYNNNKNENGLNRYRLKLTSPYKVVNTILLAHLDKATDAYDADYDAELFSIGDDSFYSKLNAKKLQIQARKNPLMDADVIELGTKYSVSGTYKISLGKTEGAFVSDQKIYLKDKLNNTYTDLTSQDYSFSASKGIDESRFEIVYKGSEVLETGASAKSDFTVYKDGTDYVVTSSKVLGKVEIYDGVGRLMHGSKTSNKSIRIDSSSFINGIYIMKVENSGDIRTKKIIK